MKRQRNTQQVKEQESCPPNQTKEEEVGNLPEKEFRILIVKMIQNLEIKMETQINSLETRTEKMQERFNKDLEEIKQTIYSLDVLLAHMKFCHPWKSTQTLIFYWGSFIRAYISYMTDLSY